MAIHPQNIPLITRTGVIKPIIQLLSTGNDATKAQATGVICNLAINNKTAAELAKEGAIKPLVALLVGSLFPATMAALALANLAMVDGHKVLIAKEGAVPPLVRLLGSGCDETILYAVQALVRLASHSDIQEPIIEEGSQGDDWTWPYSFHDQP